MRSHSPRRGARSGCGLMAAIGVILLGLVAGLYPWATADPIPRDPTLIPGTPIPEAIRYVVVPEESDLTLTIDSMIGRVSGGAEMKEGTVELVREGDGWRVIANLSMDVSTLNVGNDMVNGLIRRTLGADAYPVGVFLARSETTIPDIEHTTDTVNLTGELELRGVVRPYTFATVLVFEGDRLILDSAAEVDANDFGVTVPRIVGNGIMDSTMHVMTAREDRSTAPSG